MKIAQGTAYAASNRITVEEFFKRGAAIGVQRQQHAARCENNPQGLWDNEAVFALSKVLTPLSFNSVFPIPSVHFLFSFVPSPRFIHPSCKSFSLTTTICCAGG